MTHISDSVPVVAVTFEEHTLLHVTPHENKTGLHGFSAYEARVTGRETNDFWEVHDDGASLELIASIKIHRTRLDQFHDLGRNCDTSNRTQPFEVI